MQLNQAMQHERHMTKTSDTLVVPTRCRTSWMTRVRHVVVVPPLEAIARARRTIAIVVEVRTTIGGTIVPVAKVRTAIITAIVTAIVVKATATITIVLSLAERLNSTTQSKEKLEPSMHHGHDPHGEGRSPPSPGDQEPRSRPNDQGPNGDRRCFLRRQTQANRTSFMPS